MNRATRSWFVFASLLLVGMAVAQDFKGEIESLRRNAEDVRDFEAGVEDQASQLAEYGLKDLALAKAWLSDLAAEYEQTAKLFEQGKPDAGRAKWGEVDSKGRERGRWRERMDARWRQRNLAPQEHNWTQLRNDLPDHVKPSFDQFVNARRAASEAWGKAAELTVPDVDKLVLQQAQFAARTAEVEAQILERRFNWTNQLRDLLINRDLTPELIKRIAEIEKIQSELDDMQRQREALEQKMNALNDQREQLLGPTYQMLGEALQKKREAEQKAGH